MALKGRKSSSKNPQIFSHEFVIQNHADIVSCIAMVFVIGLMVQVRLHLKIATFTICCINIMNGSVYKLLRTKLIFVTLRIQQVVLVTNSAWSRGQLEKLIVAQLVNKSPGPSIRRSPKWFLLLRFSD
jgi:hypothetical protein